MQHAHTTATRSQSSHAGTEPAEPPEELRSTPFEQLVPSPRRDQTATADDRPRTAAEAVAQAPSPFDTTGTGRIPNGVDGANQAMPDPET